MVGTQSLDLQYGMLSLIRFDAAYSANFRPSRPRHLTNLSYPRSQTFRYWCHDHQGLVSCYLCNYQLVGVQVFRLHRCDAVAAIRFHECSDSFLKNRRSGLMGIYIYVQARCVSISCPRHAKRINPAALIADLPLTPSN